MALLQPLELPILQLITYLHYLTKAVPFVQLVVCVLVTLQVLLMAMSSLLQQVLKQTLQTTPASLLIRQVALVIYCSCKRPVMMRL